MYEQRLILGIVGVRMSRNTPFSGLFRRSRERTTPVAASSISQKPLHPADLPWPFQPDFFWGYSLRRPALQKGIPAKAGILAMTYRRRVTSIRQVRRPCQGAGGAEGTWGCRRLRTADAPRKHEKALAFPPGLFVVEFWSRRRPCDPRRENNQAAAETLASVATCEIVFSTCEAIW